VPPPLAKRQINLHLIRRIKALFCKLIERHAPPTRKFAEISALPAASRNGDRLTIIFLLQKKKKKNTMAALIGGRSTWCDDNQRKDTQHNDTSITTPV
jgi:hypothetical protein